MNDTVVNTTVQCLLQLQEGVASAEQWSRLVLEDDADKGVITECSELLAQLHVEREARRRELAEVESDIKTLEGIVSNTSADKRLRVGEMQRALKSLHGLKQQFENGRDEMEDEDSGAEDMSGALASIKDMLDSASDEVLSSPPPFAMSLAPPLLPTAAESSSRVRTPPIQTQQAPMKSCKNCNAEIHRNAPCCPSCKEKVRSRNGSKRRRTAHSMASPGM